MANLLGYIPDDGYTIDGYLAEVPRLHRAVRFKFRPMLVRDRTIYYRKVEGLKPEDQDRYRARLLREYLKEWDFKAPDGTTTLPLTADNFLRVGPELFLKLFLVISGVVPFDPDPDKAQEDFDRELDDKMEAADRNSLVGDVRDLRDAKN